MLLLRRSIQTLFILSLIHICFNAKASVEEQKKHGQFVDRMVAKGYTAKQVRLLSDWYLRVRKAS